MSVFGVALLHAPSGPPVLSENVTRRVALCKEAQSLGADVALFQDVGVGYHSVTELERCQSLAVAIGSEFVRCFRDLAAELNMGIARSIREQAVRGGERCDAVQPTWSGDSN